MTSTDRDRLAAPIVIAYGLMLVGGLVVYTAVSAGHAAPALWVGSILGTSVGFIAALHRLRWWVALSLFAAVAMIGSPLMPAEVAGSHLWKAFIPAAICAYASLSDRWSLAAFWFPTVIWMLSILDRGRGHASPDDAGLAMLAVLAALFVVFLKVRESRRVALWRTVSTRPVATAARTTLLGENPGRPLLRMGWGLAVTAIAFAFTGWLAPKLWGLENFTDTKISKRGHGRPCCPTKPIAIETRSRIGEYFDEGRTDVIARKELELDNCVVCPPDGDDDGSGDAWAASAYLDTWGDYYGYGGYGSYGGHGGGGGGGYGYGGAGGPNASSSSNPGPSYAPNPTQVPTSPSPNYSPSHRPTATEHSIASILPPPTPTLPPIAPPPPPHVAPPPPPHVAPPPPKVAPPPPPPPTPTHPNNTVVATNDPIAVPGVTVETHHNQPTASRPPPDTADKRESGFASWLHWLTLLVVGALVYQGVGIAMRPIRRAITLRHLRRPFWDETIDQRVSNAWQLALVGLRDAGHRATIDESPTELARRANVEGLDRCATILERARYGIEIGPDDVAEMMTTADQVYRAARKPLGPFARVAAALRRPLA